MQRYAASRSSAEHRSEVTNSLLQNVRELLTRALPALFHPVDVRVFGSSGNDFHSDSSDVDLCLLTAINGTSVIETLRRVFRILQSDDAFSRVSPILSARVPLVTFFHTANEY